MMEPNESLSAAFDRVCAEAAQKPAFTEQSGFEVTFERFYYTVHSLAHALVQRDFRAGQTVAIAVPDFVFGTALLLAAMRRGLRVQALSAKAVTAKGLPPTIERLITTDKALAGLDRCVLLDNAWLEPAPGPVEDVGVGGLISGTSGTTGETKLQFCSERVLMAKQRLSQQHFSSLLGPVVQGYSPGSGVGLLGTLQVLLTGRHQWHLGQGVGLVLKAMETTDFGEARMPPIALREFALAAQKTDGRHRINTVYSGGSELNQNLAALVREVFGARVFTSFGSSEAGGISVMELTGNEPPGAVGHILDHLDWRFLDPVTGEIAKSNSGELSVRVPDEHQKSNYLGSTGPYDADGWIRTGDLGFIDDTGMLIINGRVQQFLNIGGEKATPSLFERMVIGFGNVADAAAYTIPDTLGVDRLQLAVIPADGFDEAVFAAKCAESRLAKLPVDVFVVDRLPYGAMGKVARADLPSMAKPRPPVYSR